MSLQRWALGIEYDGGSFHGWQTQAPTTQVVDGRPIGSTLPTVQGALEAALSQIESGEHKIRKGTREKLARAMGITASMLQ